MPRASINYSKFRCWVGLLLPALCALGAWQHDTNPSAAADWQTQTLDPRRSSVEFELSSGLTAIHGRFQKVSARLNLNTEDLTASRVKIQVDLSDVDIFTASGAQAWPITMLFRTLPSPIAAFQSAQIFQRGASYYLVRGVASVQGRKKEAEIPVTIVKTSPKESRFTGRLAGDLVKAQIPAQLAVIASKGSLKFDLTFTSAPTIP